MGWDAVVHKAVHTSGPVALTNTKQLIQRQASQNSHATMMGSVLRLTWTPVPSPSVCIFLRGFEEDFMLGAEAITTFTTTQPRLTLA